MISLGPFDWKKGWTVLGVLLGLYGFAVVEPEAGEAVRTMITLGAIGCLLWALWRLIQYE